MSPSSFFLDSLLAYLIDLFPVLSALVLEMFTLFSLFSLKMYSTLSQIICLCLESLWDLGEPASVEMG